MLKIDIIAGKNGEEKAAFIENLLKGAECGVVRDTESIREFAGERVILNLSERDSLKEAEKKINSLGNRFKTGVIICLISGKELLDEKNDLSESVAERIFNSDVIFVSDAVTLCEKDRVEVSEFIKSGNPTATFVFENDFGSCGSELLENLEENAAFTKSLISGLKNFR